MNDYKRLQTILFNYVRLQTVFYKIENKKHPASIFLPDRPIWTVSFLCFCAIIY